MTDKRLNVDLTANDRASSKIDKVADAADSLDKMSPEVDVSADISRAQSALDGLRTQISEFDGPVGDVGQMFDKLASPQGAIAGIAGGLLLAGNHAANLAVEADNLASLTGDSVENASRLNNVWKQSGADAKDLQDVLLQMGGVLTTNTQLTEKLGVDLSDGRTLGERFAQVVELVANKFDDAAERSVVMSQLFGEEGVRQVNTVIAQVGNLGDAIDAVPTAAVVDEDDVAQAREYKAQLAQFKVEMSALATTIGEQVLPLMTSMAELAVTITDTLGKLDKGFNTNFFTGEEITDDPFAEIANRETEAQKRRTSQWADYYDNLSKLDAARRAAEAASLTDSAEVWAEYYASRQRHQEEVDDAERDAQAENARMRQQYVDSRVRGEELVAEAVREAAEIEQAAMAAGAQAAQDFYDSINESYTSAAESALTFQQDSSSSFESYMADLEASAQKLETWRGHVTAIGAETSPEFVQHLLDMGVGSLDMVAQMRMTEGGVQDAFDAYTRFAEATNTDIVAEMTKAGGSGSKALMAAMGNETKTATGNAARQGQQIASAQIEAMAEEFRSNTTAVEAAAAHAQAVIAATRNAFGGGGGGGSPKAAQ